VYLKWNVTQVFERKPRDKRRGYMDEGDRDGKGLHMGSFAAKDLFLILFQIG